MEQYLTCPVCDEQATELPSEPHPETGEPSWLDGTQVICGLCGASLEVMADGEEARLEVDPDRWSLALVQEGPGAS